MPLSHYMIKNLQCPVTKSALTLSSGVLQSVDGNCLYPLVNGCPVILNENNSLFKIETFRKEIQTTINLNQSRLSKFLANLMPSSSVNLKAKGNYKMLINSLPKKAKILVLGGSYKGEGMQDFYSNRDFDLVGSDVSFGPDCDLICDAHDIPFKEETFDCVIVQAVLEHVVDPQRCVKEIYRVLRPDGYVYAETPFMQQVHMQQYDFTRFTHLGHRRLFRCFVEVKSGPVGGPGMALAWSYIYFLRSFSSSATISRYLVLFGRLTSFFLKYFDYLLIDKPGSFDAAAGLYFLGQKSGNILSDSNLLTQFKGL